ncbi:MAG: hypothetical protein HQL32_14395, partial [Planctomycetes bacterium]|nr:hypothetical protein [Planctomycetota bacterium]
MINNIPKMIFCVALFTQWCPLILANPIQLNVEQLTYGEKNHFFGYIGQCLTVPWNKSDRYILAMEIYQYEHMPEPDEAATIILIDRHQSNKKIPIEKTYAWNLQQGTFLYWNPKALETQFFFNDRDLETNK